MAWSWKEWVLWSGSPALLLCYALFYVAFLTAYFSPDKRTVINVNSLGEANFELVLFTALLVAGVVTVFVAMQKAEETPK